MTQVHYDSQIINTADITTGSSSAYLLDRPMTVLADALRVYFEPHVNNVAGPVTINVEGTGAIAIVYDDNTDLLADELKVGAKYGIVYSDTLSKYVLQRSKNTVSGDPELFICRGATQALGSGFSDDKNNWIVQYGSDIALLNSTGQVHQKVIAGPATSVQMIAQATIGIASYGGTMVYQGNGYILDKNDGNNVQYVDLTSDLANVANWSAVTVSHTWTYGNQLLLGIDAGKVYILDYDNTGNVVKRFTYGVSTWTYEADQFIPLNPIGGAILGANADGIANSQGLTIQWEALDIWMISYDYTGTVLNSYGDSSLITAPGYFRATENTQYISQLDNTAGGIQVFSKFGI